MIQGTAGRSVSQEVQRSEVSQADTTAWVVAQRLLGLTHQETKGPIWTECRSKGPGGAGEARKAG